MFIRETASTPAPIQFHGGACSGSEKLHTERFSRLIDILGGVRRRLLCGLYPAGASAPASGWRHRIRTRSWLCVDGRLLGFARIALGVDQRPVGTSTTRPRRMGAGPLGAPWRALAVQPRPLAIGPSYRVASGKWIGSGTAAPSARGSD